jgi:long-chain acyl-CoA synthetase
MGKMDKKLKNLGEAILAAMDTYAQQPCFQVKHGARYKDITYHQFQTLSFRLARYFHEQGVTNGERVAIAAENCLEWIVTYVACLLAGGVAVPVRTSLASDTLHFILQDSGARLAVLQDPGQIQTVMAGLSAGADGKLPDLKTVLIIDYDGEKLRPGLTAIDTILADPDSLTSQEQTALRYHAKSIKPNALASIDYVAGSDTARPKGAVFDHRQRLAMLRHMAEWFSFDEDDLAFTFRSWSDVPNLAATLHYFVAGIPNVLIERYELMAENMQQTSPTVMVTAPYFFEVSYDQIMDEVKQLPESSQEVFQWAVTKGKEYHAAGADASPELRQEYARADLTFFNQIRGEMGGRIRRLYSTGASLPIELAEFFEAVGLPMLNLYSLTEAGGFPAISQLDLRHPGSVGRPASGFEIRIADDDEIMVRGETVMREYWQRPEETKQAFDGEGWLHSGDLGHIDEDGFLHVTARKQHVIVLSTGRKITPATIENELMSSPFITQAAVFGEGKPYVSAMILPNLEVLADHFKGQTNAKGAPVTTTTHPKVRELLDKAIGEVNSKLDRWEQIREYSLLDQPLSKDAGELTASMKISRHVVAERYAAQIEAMYPLTVKFDERVVTEVQTTPERLRELLEKESILDAWMADAGIEFLFDLARSKQIDAPSMVHICDTAAMIAQMESEEKPLSTALIVGDPIRIARVLPASQIQLIQNDHIRRARKNLVNLAKMVDGHVLGYVVDNHGRVRDIRKLKLEKYQDKVEQVYKKPANVLLGPQFRHHAAISELCDAVVFFVPAGGRQVRVFAKGHLVGRYSNGDWSPENISRVPQAIAELAEKKAYDQALVQRVLRCAFQMSESNLGAIFIIGDADRILDHADASEISHFALIVSTDLNKLPDQELINFAKQDGATVIDSAGKFRGCMVLLRPDAETQAEIGSGKGARHSSAAKMSAEADCLAITVSQDGPITMYDCGRRILSL